MYKPNVTLHKPHTDLLNALICHFNVLSIRNLLHEISEIVDTKISTSNEKIILDIKQMYALNSLSIIGFIIYIDYINYLGKKND